METLTPGPAAYTHLLAALQKSRSIAAENGAAQMHADFESLGVRVPLGEKIIEDDNTVNLLADLIDGTRTLEPALWMNLAHLVKISPRWGAGLISRQVQMPEPMEAHRQATEYLVAA